MLVLLHSTAKEIEHFEEDLNSNQVIRIKKLVDEPTNHFNKLVSRVRESKTIVDEVRQQHLKEVEATLGERNASLEDIAPLRVIDFADQVNRKVLERQLCRRLPGLQIDADKSFNRSHEHLLLGLQFLVLLLLVKGSVDRLLRKLVTSITGALLLRRVLANDLV